MICDVGIFDHVHFDSLESGDYDPDDDDGAHSGHLKESAHEFRGLRGLLNQFFPGFKGIVEFQLID